MLLPVCITEIRIWSIANKEEITVRSAVYWPHEVAVTPWCCLVPEGEPPPSTPYFQLHKLSESRGETVERVYQRYKEKANLKALFIIADDSIGNHHKLKQIKDPPFLIVIIPTEKYKKKTKNLVQDASGLEATVTAPFATDSRGLRKSH